MEENKIGQYAEMELLIAELETDPEQVSRETMMRLISLQTDWLGETLEMVQEMGIWLAAKDTIIGDLTKASQKENETIIKLKKDCLRLDGERCKMLLERDMVNNDYQQLLNDYLNLLDEFESEQP